MTTSPPVTFSAPKLETERLIMRAPQIGDPPAHAAFFASPRSGFVGGPMPDWRAWRTLAMETGHWVLNGFGRWILEEKETGDTVGLVGLWHPMDFPEDELGWDLFEGATGKGYATEAAMAARAYAYDMLRWTTLTSFINPNNTASAAVATRLGATFDYEFDHASFGKVQIWRHPGPDTADRPTIYRSLP